MGAGCDWLAIGWKYSGPWGNHASSMATSYIVSYAEANGSGAWPSLAPTLGAKELPLLTTNSQQIRITGLRAGVGYEVRVAATRGGERSGWAVAPVLRTDKATQPPEPPLAPIVHGGIGGGAVAGGGACHIMRLRLPTSAAGCRSATDATVQLHAVLMYGAAGVAQEESWREYEASFSADELEISDLHVNVSYRFRLVAHNAAGKSHPGTATEAVQLCDAPPVAAAASTLASTGASAGARGAAHAGGSDVPLGAYIIGLCVLIAGGMRCLARRALSGRSPPGRRSGYDKVVAHDDELCDADGGMSEGAYDAWAATLCVHVFVPQSIRPIQIDMSTKGASTSAALLKQMCLVVSEVAGRQPPFAPEELSVVYEDEDGAQQLLNSGCAINEVFRASKVVASILGARVAPFGPSRAAEARPIRAKRAPTPGRDCETV